MLQYVEHVALSSGNKVVRIKAQEYRKGLFDLPEGPVYVGGWEDRDEGTVVASPPIASATRR